VCLKLSRLSDSFIHLQAVAWKHGDNEVTTLEEFNSKCLDLGTDNSSEEDLGNFREFTLISRRGESIDCPVQGKYKIVNYESPAEKTCTSQDEPLLSQPSKLLIGCSDRNKMEFEDNCEREDGRNKVAGRRQLTVISHNPKIIPDNHI
jgi:hypothetical protein